MQRGKNDMKGAWGVNIGVEGRGQNIILISERGGMVLDQLYGNEYAHRAVSWPPSWCWAPAPPRWSSGGAAVQSSPAHTGTRSSRAYLRTPRNTLDIITVGKLFHLRKFTIPAVPVPFLSAVFRICINLIRIRFQSKSQWESGYGSVSGSGSAHIKFKIYDTGSYLTIRSTYFQVINIFSLYWTNKCNCR